MKSINFLLVLFLVSCSAPGDSPKQNDIERNTTHNEFEAIINDDLNQELDIPEGWIQVEMNTVTFLLEKIDMSWDMSNGENEQRCSFQDTAFFDLWPGDWMEDKVIKIKGDEFEITDMFVQEVTSIGIDSERPIEVPFCVLSSWQKSPSEWIQIQPINDEFLFEISNMFNSEPLTVELDDLKEGIKNSCGNEWFEEFKDADSLNKIPFSETEIQYNYKIISRELNSGETYENIIVFNVPTSC